MVDRVSDLFCFGRMEQQDKPASTSHFTEEVLPQHLQQQQSYPERRSDTTSSSASHPSPTSLPHEQTGDSLSTSEPSLRFPRPVGSHHLANWISASDPDIMHVTSHAIEDTGLADSTYELISGVEDSESWSQDGNDHEYISESVSSLDPFRPDDVQSIADTEQMTDDEFIPMPAPMSSDNIPTSVAPDPTSTPLLDDDNIESDSDTEASRSSLDYTKQSLKTPSMMTPEASKIYERPPEMHPTLEWIYKIYTASRDRVQNHAQYLQRGLEDGSVSLTHPTIAILLLLQVFIFGLAIHSVIGIVGHVFTRVHQAPAVPAVTTTATAAPQLSGSPTSTSSAGYLDASHSTTGLTVRRDHDEGSMDWFFGSKKPEITFSTQSKNTFLAQVPEEVKNTWTANNCVQFTAARDGQPVKTTLKFVREGLLLRFPRRETYGVVDLTLEATCKPVQKKVVKVRFVKGKLDEVFELTKHVVKDLVPVAERGLVEFKKVMEPAWDCFTKYTQSLFQFPNADDLMVMRNEISHLVLMHYDNLRTEVSHACGNLKGAQKHAVGFVHDVQTRLQLELLNAQISAKLSWLSILGKKEEHDHYLHKATSFMNSKEAAAKQRRSRDAEHAGGLS